MTRAASIRMPEDVYRRSQEIARRRKISFNQLVQNSLRREIEDEQYREMYDAATLLGLDAEESDVSFAFEVQAEVALAND